jgi:hypothetical protein
MLFCEGTGSCVLIISLVIIIQTDSHTHCAFDRFMPEHMIYCGVQSTESNSVQESAKLLVFIPFQKQN